MADPEKQNVPEKKSDSLFGDISKALTNLKEFLLPTKTPEKQKEIVASKEQQESGLLTKEIVDFKKNILEHNEVVSTKSDLEKLKKSTSLKKSIPTYVPKYSDTQQFVEQSDRISAPYIAKAADDLRNDVNRPFLSRLLT